MANVVTDKTWTLDTASTTVNVWSGPVFISKMEFHPNAADNDLIVQDGRGKTIWIVRAIAPAANHESSGIEYWENPDPCSPRDGFRLHTLDGGTLYVTVS